MTDLLENLIIHPEADFRRAGSDLLSGVLSQIHLTGDGIDTRSLSPSDRLELEADAAHICIVTKGTLHIESDDQPPQSIEAGDLALLPRRASELRLVAGAACNYSGVPLLVRSREPAQHDLRAAALHSHPPGG